MVKKNFSLNEHFQEPVKLPKNLTIRSSSKHAM